MSPISVISLIPRSSRISSITAVHQAIILPSFITLIYIHSLSVSSLISQNTSSIISSIVINHSTHPYSSRTSAICLRDFCRVLNILSIGCVRGTLIIGSR